MVLGNYIKKNPQSPEGAAKTANRRMQISRYFK